MPVNEGLHSDGDVLDLESETVVTSTMLQGNLGCADIQDGTNPVSLGESVDVAAPTGVGAAATVNSGELSVSFTKTGGLTKVEIVVLDHATQKAIKKEDSTAASPVVVTGLGSAVDCDVFCRMIDTAGRISPPSNVANATTHV